MIKVSQLLKYISELNPQKTPGRLSFYNFLRSLLDLQSPLTTDIIDDYFMHSMDFPHWASNKVQLGNEIHFLLENFNKFYQNPLDLSLIRFPQNIQIIEIENANDLLAASHQYIARFMGENDKFKLINEQNKKIIAVILRHERNIEVRVIDKKFTIREGMLEPLRPHFALFYTPDLELSSQHEHQIELAPYIWSKFNVENGKVNGLILRGYVYQELSRLNNVILEDQLKLFYPIKHLEQYFIDRRTDNYYNDLTQRIERTLALISQGDHKAQMSASIILNQAELAIENIYQDDKLLKLLVKDLKNNINLLPKVSEECPKITPIINPRIRSDLIN